jgi:hypothetical protein
MASTTRLLQRLAAVIQPQQQAAATGQTVKIVPSRPPLSRTIIDANLPTFRLIFGLAFVAYAAITTVVGVYLDLQAPLDGLVWARMIGAIAGLVVAAVIFAIQLFCAEHLWPLYYLSLIPDTLYSNRPIAWLSDRFAAVDGVQTATELYTSIVVGITISFAIARFGELLLFGVRRHSRWWLFAIEYLYVLLVCGGLLLWIG